MADRDRPRRLRMLALGGLAVNVVFAALIGWSNAATPGAGFAMLLPLLLGVPPVVLVSGAYVLETRRGGPPIGFFAGLLAALVVPYAVTIAAGLSAERLACEVSSAQTTTAC